MLVLPAGLATAGTALWRPSTLVLGLIVGVLSSAIPYSFDLLALRRLPTAVFGVLTSLNPAVAALAGLLVLGQTAAGAPGRRHRPGHDRERGHQRHRRPAQPLRPARVGA